MKRTQQITSEQIVSNYKKQFLKRIAPATLAHGLTHTLQVVGYTHKEDGTTECRLEMTFHSWMEPITGWAIVENGVVSMVEQWQVGDFKTLNPATLTRLTKCCRMADTMN